MYMNLSKGHWFDFPNYDVFPSLKSVCISANSADSDEMSHYAAFNLGLYCLQSTRLVGFRSSLG